MTETRFDALPPVPTALVVGGEALEITPLKVGELPAFARAVRSIASKVTSDPDWLCLLSEDGESVILALAIACRRPPDWVAALALDDAIRLAEAIFGANANFFIQRVVPAITQMSTRVGQQIPSLIPGVMPLPGSSGPDTPTLTS
jgi:hypothetical protein